MRDVYLFPGIVGSSFQLAQLINGVQDINFVRSISYPCMQSQTELICDVSAISEHVSNKIILENRRNDIIIIGYSFGGCVAMEVGSILERLGEVIDSMIIIDAPIPGITFDFDRSKQVGFLAPRTPFKQAKVRVTEIVCRSRKVRLLIRFLFRFMSYDHSKKLERYIIRSLREGARKRKWIPKKQSFSGLLFFSRQFVSVTSETWESLCPNMSSTTVDADHLCMLESRPLTEIARQVSSYLSSNSVCRGGK